MMDEPGEWIESSYEYSDDKASKAYCIVMNVVIGMSLFILIHSNQIHYGTKYSSIRFQTELSSLCALSSGILFLICCSCPSHPKAALMYDLFGNGLFNLCILLCDSYMFYYRLCAVIKLPKWKRVLVHMYIWIFVVLAWFPIYNLLPISLNSDSRIFRKAYLISSTVVAAAILLYNFLITLEFTKILLDAYLPAIARTSSTSRNQGVPISLQKIRVVAVKSLGHCISSCTGVICYTLVPVYGSALQILFLITGMHFWFNMTNGKHFWMVDMCMLNIAVFPESLSECNSLDMDEHMDGMMPIGSAHPNLSADVITNKEESDFRYPKSYDTDCPMSPSHVLEVDEETEHTGSVHRSQDEVNSSTITPK